MKARKVNGRTFRQWVKLLRSDEPIPENIPWDMTSESGSTWALMHEVVVNFQSRIPRDFSWWDSTLRYSKGLFWLFILVYEDKNGGRKVVRTTFSEYEVKCKNLYDVPEDCVLV